MFIYTYPCISKISYTYISVYTWETEVKVDFNNFFQERYRVGFLEIKVQW